jgi:dTDP-4-amino-4,6-dideoxygalactose transaminase
VGGMRVPLVDLKAQYGPLREELLAALTRVCDSQQFILGPEVEQLERELAAFVGARHAIGVSSGTDALLVALMALGVGPGDEVVTSAYSFVATAGSIARLGARPVFADIDPATFNLDPAAAAAAVSSRTRAIVPVHLFGLGADLDPLLDLARRTGATVVEDAAQALGARYKGRNVGTLGAAGCVSFFPTKHLGAFGDGGLVLTDAEEVAQRVRRLRVHGADRKYVHELLGGNFRLDAVQAAVLRVKAAHLPRWIAARRDRAATYRQLFAEAGLVARGVILPIEPHDHLHTYHQFVIRVPRREALRAYLAEHGVETAVYYPVPLHLQPCFAELGYRRGQCPHAEQAAGDSLALPMYPELTEAQQRYVVDRIAEFYR